MTDWKSDLEELFGARLKTDEIERRLYSRDSASLPGMIERLVDNVPKAVVQPVSKDELKGLCEVSSEYSIPLVPRGGGTSGYGGSIPAEGGIVVDFSRMNELIQLKESENTVTVEPGMIWETLAEKLAEHDLAPEIMPSSAPGATVGGWVAEGGAGIGSFSNGYVKDTIVRVKLMKPSGETVVYEGDELDLVCGSEGITGFITEVTLEVARREDQVPIMVSFDEMGDLAKFIEEITGGAIPFWHVGISNSNYVRSHHEAKGAESTPEGRYFALLTYPNSVNARDEIDKVAGGLDGKVLPREVAEEEWSDRFYPLRMKQLGPSLVPSEGVIPVDSLVELVDRLEEKFTDLALEGHFVGEEEVTILTFLMADERTPAYTFDFGKSLAVLNEITDRGGRPYSTGMYLTAKAEEALGEDRVELLRGYKEEEDPESLFNPGKLIPYGTRIMDLAMKVADKTEPAVELLAKLASDKPGKGKELPEGIGYDAFSCVNCGYCRDVCTLFDGRGWESSAPRGKFNFLRDYVRGDVDLNQDMVDTFLLCTTCKRCDDVCQAGIPIQEDWDELRGFLVDEKGHDTFSAFEMMKGSYGAERNIWAEKSDRRDSWLPEEISPVPEAETGYWAGCTASFIEPDIARNAVRIMDEGNREFAYLGDEEGCCGIPFLTAGKWDEWEKALRYNVSRIKDLGINQMVASCPGCYIALDHYYDEWTEKLGIDWDVEIVHITELTNELIDEGALDFPEEQDLDVTWHDPCHIGRHAGIYDPPRKVIESLPGVELTEMDHNREDSLCCGSVLTRVGEPTTSDKIADSRLEEARNTGCDELVTTCPCCEFQLRVGGLATESPVQIKDFSTLVARSLGYEVEDPTEDVYKSWKAFEAMIYQMSLPGMVEMMEELIPSMMDEMPDYMKKGMGGMEKMPGKTTKPLLALMKVGMPYIMPRMMDDIMPKMVPEITEYLERQVPQMSDSMREMMPDLLPGVMEAIMPTMLPKVLDQVKPEIIEEMRSRVNS